MKNKPGPKLNTQRDLKVKQLRESGLTFREIASRFGVNVKNIYRRWQRIRVGDNSIK